MEWRCEYPRPLSVNEILSKDIHNFLHLSYVLKIKQIEYKTFYFFVGQ